MLCGRVGHLARRARLRFPLVGRQCPPRHDGSRERHGQVPLVLTNQLNFGQGISMMRSLIAHEDQLMLLSLVIHSSSSSSIRLARLSAVYQSL
jgi:hypothetical protein